MVMLTMPVLILKVLTRAGAGSDTCTPHSGPQTSSSEAETSMGLGFRV